MRDPTRAVDIYLTPRDCGPFHPGVLAARYRPPGFTATAENTVTLVFTEDANEVRTMQRDMAAGLPPDIAEPPSFLAQNLPGGLPA